MQTFTRKEIEWTAQALAGEAGRLKHASGMAAASDAERELFRLKAEQLQDIADRLSAAAESKDKRIAIRQRP